MNKSEMICRLAQLPDDAEIMILDGFNGGGSPRTINLGPCEWAITAADANQTADCEDRAGTTVYVLGYGCY